VFGVHQIWRTVPVESTAKTSSLWLPQLTGHGGDVKVTPGRNSQARGGATSVGAASRPRAQGGGAAVVGRDLRSTLNARPPGSQGSAADPANDEEKPTNTAKCEEQKQRQKRKTKDQEQIQKRGHF
jgi:hypothetical protein